jgi:hypothetical protein
MPTRIVIGLVGGLAIDCGPGRPRSCGPVEPDASAAAGPLDDLQRSADLLGALSHAQQPHVAFGRWSGEYIDRDARARVVDLELHIFSPNVEVDGDRRPAVFHCIGERLLGDTEHGEFYVGRKAVLTLDFEADFTAGQRLEFGYERMDGRPQTQVVEDGQAQVGADGSEALYGTPNRGGRIVGSVAVEPVNEHRQVLDHVVVDVSCDAPAFRLRLVDDQFAFDCGLGRQPGHRPEREDPQRNHHEYPGDEWSQERRVRDRRQRHETERRQSRRHANLDRIDRPAQLRGDRRTAEIPDRNKSRDHDCRRGQSPTRRSREAAFHSRERDYAADNRGSQRCQCRDEHDGSPHTGRCDRLGHVEPCQQHRSRDEDAGEHDRRRTEREIRRHEEERSRRSRKYSREHPAKGRTRTGRTAPQEAHQA